jgi:hypothetical protein
MLRVPVQARHTTAVVVHSGTVVVVCVRGEDL